MNYINTFHGIEPQLIANTTLDGIEAPLKIEVPREAHKIFNGLGNFYSNYIAPNLFSIIVIVAFATYLIINYIIKKDKKKETEKTDLKNVKKIQKIEELENLEDLEELEDLEDKDEINDSDISNYISDDYLITETE